MKKFKIKFTRNFLIAIVVILVSLFAWAGLTKAGYIDNYLGIEILCSNDVDDVPSDWIEIDTTAAWKPVIYLYPQEKTDVYVKLDYQGKLIADYPDYNYDINGWEVTAFPDGSLLDNRDKQEYSYLFWEGIPRQRTNYDMSTGFVVKGEDTKLFLQKKLTEIGLSPKEYNEFIVFWYPRMKDNAYNLIHFAGDEYTKTAPLSIEPKPDSVLRVFMVYKKLEQPVSVEEQLFEGFERSGFSVVEWGGTEMID